MGANFVIYGNVIMSNFC